jgi:hypothetical protein
MKKMNLIVVTTILLLLSYYSYSQSNSSIAQPDTNESSNIENQKENEKVDDSALKNEDSIADILLGNSFNYSIYSDFKGFKSDQPNGILQSEAFFNFNFRNEKPDEKSSKAKSLELFHNIMIGANFTKIGDNMRYKDVNINKDSSSVLTKHVHYIDLVRYSNFEGYIKLNLINMRFDKFENSFVNLPLRFYIDLFGKLASTGIRDTTLVAGSQEFNANSIGYGVNLKLGTYNIPKKIGHLDFEVGYTSYTLQLQNNNFKVSGGPLFSPEDNPLNNKYQSEPHANSINKFDFRIQYAPDLEKNDKNIFFRVMYHTNPVSSSYSDLYNTNSYLQVQLGYIGTFSSLFPKESK